MRDTSALERARLGYPPELPGSLVGGLGRVEVVETGATRSASDAEAIRDRFPRSFGRPAVELVSGDGLPHDRPLTVGVLLSGGQAPGGHNVILGVFDALRGSHAGARLYGFLGGPKGLITGRQRELDSPVLAAYRNTGGFDLIGSGRDKIETDEQLESSRKTCESLKLDGLVIIGGDDSNTNAAVLAEFFLARGTRTIVVGVPKTIDGDLKGHGVETSFGFDTATKVYSELVGNICRDAASAGKYWHFVRLMGRSASHVALECALATRPNVTVIGEEVRESGITLAGIAERIATAVRRRAENGRGHGVCLVPEGLIEFIPEMGSLIDELNRVMQEVSGPDGASEAGRAEAVRRRLGADAGRTFDALSERIRNQLLLDRDSHGNVQVSRIDTEALLVEQVEQCLARWNARGEFSGKFQVQTHFFGYEGRSAAPSNFDADYTYTLGQVAAAMIAFERTGYLCVVQDLAGPVGRWRPGAVPLTSLMQIETRKGRPTPVIGKALVATDGHPFRAFRARRERWEIEDHYVYPGAIQYFGPADVCRQPTLTLRLEHGHPAETLVGPEPE